MIEAKIHKVLFGPDDNIEHFITDQLDKAKETISMMVFWFTWKPIAERLLEANKRGVKIKMILDSRSAEIKQKDVDIENETLIPEFLTKAGLEDCEVNIYGGELLHHKTILIDDDIVLTGTCNFFNASINRHEENYMLIQSKELKDLFQKRYDFIKKNSKEWKK